MAGGERRRGGAWGVGERESGKKNDSVDRLDVYVIDVWGDMYLEGRDGRDEGHGGAEQQCEHRDRRI